MAGELVARLRVEPVRAGAAELFRAVGVIENAGVEAVVINVAALSSPSLALEIVDAAGERVLLPPPGVPGGAPATEELMPGAVREFELGGFLPAWTAPGQYRVRLRYVPGGAIGAAVYSEWVAFVLEG